MAVLNNHVSACLLWLWIFIVCKVAQTNQASREPTLGWLATYTREELLHLWPFAPVDPGLEFLEIKPKAGAQVRKRGQRGRIRVRDSRRGYKPVLPSVIMGHVHSLINKMDELTACLKSDQMYRQCSLLCFSETWISNKILESHLNLDRFSLLRMETKLKQARRKVEAFVPTSTSDGVTLDMSRSRRECVTLTSNFLR